MVSCVDIAQIGLQYSLARAGWLADLTLLGHLATPGQAAAEDSV
jgi:hypothetical protein